MLKKTTVYLSEGDMTLLRKKSAIKHITIAEAIRLSIQEACRPKTKQEKAVWDSLDKVWSKMEKVAASKVESAIGKVVNEVRSGKKTRRRS